MKKKSIFTFLICVVFFTYFCYTRKKTVVENIFLENVEALANGEHGTIYCIGLGDVSCDSYKVDYKNGTR